MSNWTFDLDQIRKNWDRAAEQPPARLPDKYAKVETPKEPYKEARAVLERVQSMIFTDLEKHRNELSPFFDRVTEAMNNLEGAGADKGGELRAELERAIADLEDMIAVFGQIWR